MPSSIIYQGYLSIIFLLGCGLGGFKASKKHEAITEEQDLISPPGGLGLLNSTMAHRLRGWVGENKGACAREEQATPGKKM